VCAGLGEEEELDGPEVAREERKGPTTKSRSDQGADQARSACGKPTPGAASKFPAHAGAARRALVSGLDPHRTTANPWACLSLLFVNERGGMPLAA
jgi:hypothetical protein